MGDVIIADLMVVWYLRNNAMFIIKMPETHPISKIEQGKEPYSTEGRN